MSNFCALTGYCSVLTEDFDSMHVVMCVESNKIAKALTTNKHSYLIISDGIRCEHVKVKVVDGKVIVIDRGVGWTDAEDWPKGTRVKFDWIDQAWQDAYECLQNNDEAEENCDIKIGEVLHTYVGTDDQGRKCYEVDDTRKLVLKDCKTKYTLSDVSYESEPLDSNEILIDGVYENATITVVDGCIVKVGSGCKTTIGGCSVGCACSKCTNTEPEEV